MRACRGAALDARLHRSYDSAMDASGLSGAELVLPGLDDLAHGRYNALIRRLVSFERAAECVR